MGSFDIPDYRVGLSNAFNLDLEHRSENFFVKVSSKDRPAASVGEPILVLTKHSYSERYETPPYKSEDEARSHACGWIDCGFYNPIDSEKDEEAWKKAYTELKKNYEEAYKITLSPAAEKAYKEGWDKKLNDKALNE